MGQVMVGKRSEGDEDSSRCCQPNGNYLYG